MKKIQSANLAAMIIGLISIAFAIYSATTGAPFKDYFFGLFIGITLFGTAFINNSEWKKKGDN